MDTIRTYIENVFKTLPQTEDVLRIKSELTSDMEAKYQELRSAGESESAAVAKVIGDFGNIDELLDAMDIAPAAATVPQSSKPELPTLSPTVVDEFLAGTKKISRFIGAAVTTILVGVAVMLSCYQLPFFTDTSDFFAILPVVILLLFVLPAVALFIYAGSLNEKYKYIEDGRFSLTTGLKESLTIQYEKKRPANMIGIIIGVCLCIFAVVVLLLFIGVSAGLSEAVYTTHGGITVISFNAEDRMVLAGVSLLLVIVGIACFLFITSGMMISAYQKLLRLGDYSEEQKEAQKIIGIVAGIVWPLVVAVFLIWGFVFDGWDIAWVVFPITGVLFGAFAGTVSMVNESKHKV